MLVGPTGAAKTQAWKVLLASLQQVDSIKSEFFVIDPKAISKEELYGVLDNTTMEWFDGIFTKILRNVLNEEKQQKRY